MTYCIVFLILFQSITEAQSWLLKVTLIVFLVLLR